MSFRMLAVAAMLPPLVTQSSMTPLKGDAEVVAVAMAIRAVSTDGLVSVNGSWLCLSHSTDVNCATFISGNGSSYAMSNIQRGKVFAKVQAGSGRMRRVAKDAPRVVVERPLLDGDSVVMGVLLRFPRRGDDAMSPQDRLHRVVLEVGGRNMTVRSVNVDSIERIRPSQH